MMINLLASRGTCGFEDIFWDLFRERTQWISLRFSPSNSQDNDGLIGALTRDLALKSVVDWLLAAMQSFKLFSENFYFERNFYLNFENFTTIPTNWLQDLLELLTLSSTLWRDPWSASKQSSLERENYFMRSLSLKWQFIMNPEDKSRRLVVPSHANSHSEAAAGKRKLSLHFIYKWISMVMTSHHQYFM